MPSFARNEENYPVATQYLTSTTSRTSTSSSAAVFGKGVASSITTSQALSPVNSNTAANANGPRPFRYSPPPPTSPPPSPPVSNQKLADDCPPYYHRQLSSTPSDDDRSSAASSVDMNGHGGSSTGGAASSQATTVPPDEDLRLDGCGGSDNAKDVDRDLISRRRSDAKDIDRDLISRRRSDAKDVDRDLIDSRRENGDRMSSQKNTPTHSISAPAIPQRPPPPTPQKPLASPLPFLDRPEAPSMPPPPPPKPESFARKSKPIANGGPISVPNPMAIPDRTRVATNNQTQNPSLLAPPSQRAWTNGTNTEESEQTDASPDDLHPRHSVASTGASSIQPSVSDVYGIRQVNSNKGNDETAYNNATGAATAAATPDSISHSQFSNHSPNPQLLQAGQSPAPPHRFSSPPAYNPAAASTSGTATGSSTHLSPNVGLKHRHTLEVPKATTTARNSRDSQDAVFTSGRFSPTAAGYGGGSGSGSISGVRRASLSLARRNTRSLHSDLPRDEVAPDEDALRWAEAYRQKRASKKRRMEQDDDQVLVGTKVDETHTNWVAAYNMLTGIRVSVSRTNAKLDRPLTDEDFGAKQKSTFDIAGNELVPSAKYDFKFKDYAPWVFRHLRSLFHLDPADYLMSLAGKYILSELGSPGKSGSFFYFSRDYRYIIKTIHHSEHKFLRKILKDYYKHVTENPNTLLSQFFGLHRVKMPYGRKIHFVVMNNLFPPHRDIHQTFDLKGSTIGRDYPEELLAKNPRATLKDLNWLRRHQHLELGIIKKRLFLEQLQKDVQLLQRLQIMDYSLLVGTHDVKRGNDENLRGKILQVFEPGRDNQEGGQQQDPHSVLMRTPSKLEHQRKTRELRQMLKFERPIPIGESSNKMPDELDDNKQSIFYKDDGGLQATHQDNTLADEIYYLGVIDCLTHYGMVKKIEHFWKGLSHDRNQISALPPQQYGERFLKFMSGITMSPEDVAHEAQYRSQAAAVEAVLAASPNAGPSGSGGDEHDDGIAMSGRERGRESNSSAQQQQQHGSGSWTSGLRHRSGASGHSQRNSEGGISSADRDAADHLAAENEAQKISPPSDMETTQTSVSVGGGMVLPGVGAGPSPTSSPSSSAPAADRRESQQPALPIVEEAGESSSTGGRSQSQSSRFSTRTAESDGRPATPAKDGRYSNPASGYTPREKPPSPPSGGYLKPESADSGYGVSGTRSRSGTLGSGHKVKMELSRDSLDKDLPPLPKLDGTV